LVKFKKKTLQINIAVNGLYDTMSHCVTLVWVSHSLVSYESIIAMLVWSVFFIYLNFCYYRLLTFIFHKVV